MKVGIFGGSFNPVHNDHLKIIRGVLKRKIVDEIWVVPCKTHPFAKDLAGERQRVEMIELAIKNTEGVKVCEIELEMVGKNYTINTVRNLKEKYGHDFFLIVGSDILDQIKGWYKVRELFEEVGFIVYLREGYGIKGLEGVQVLEVIEEGASDISSSEVRRRVSEELSIKSLVPKEIAFYIEREGLYR